jgi:hypothetical protein
MAGPFKMKGFSGFGNSPMKQKGHKYEREAQARTSTGWSRLKENIKSLAKPYLTSTYVKKVTDTISKKKKEQ